MKVKTDISRKPITVDTKAIAKGLYGRFDDNERARLAFGLLPERKLRPVREHLARVAERLWPEARVFSRKELDEFDEFDAVGFDNEATNAERVAKERKDFVRKVEHQIALHLYGVARGTTAECQNQRPRRGVKGDRKS